MAPSFTEGALEILRAKKNVRLLKVDMSSPDRPVMQYVSVRGGLLAQDADTRTDKVVKSMTVTDKQPSDEMMSDLDFAWKIVKHVKSNAIVVVKDGGTAGVGAGQMERIGAAEIALKEADVKGPTGGLVMASDGLFPFEACVELGATGGLTGQVQPGARAQDNDSIAKANEAGIPMLFTGTRHFKH